MMSKLFSWLSPKRRSGRPSPQPVFEPRSELEIALVAAAHEPGARAEFQKLLLNSELYVATPEDPSSAGSVTLRKGETLRILNVTGQDGRPIPAIFTDETRLAAAFGAGTSYLLIPAATLLEMIAADGAVLNPGQPYGVVWSRDEILQMLGRPVRRTVEKDTQIMVGVPAKQPEELIHRIDAAVASEPAIEEAWLALAHWPAENQSSWLLDIRSNLDPDRVAERLNEVLRSGPFDGLPLDLVINRPGGDAGAGIRIKPAELH